MRAGMSVADDVAWTHCREGPQSLGAPNPRGFFVGSVVRANEDPYHQDVHLDRTLTTEHS
jgi:hypothetical protein